MAFRFKKYAIEEYSIDLDWTGELPTGKTLSSVAASATRNDTGADATATILGSTSPSVNGEKATVRVKAGTSGIEYTIKLLSTLNDASVFEDHWIMQIR